MKRKRNATAALVAGVLAAASLAPSAAGAFKPARWCPEGLCPGPIDRQVEEGERGDAGFVPVQVRPKIKPFLETDAFGREAWRSGGWLME